MAFKTMAWRSERNLESSVCTSSWRSIRCIARNQGRREAVLHLLPMHFQKQIQERFGGSRQGAYLLDDCTKRH